jgi:hypothetical protein
VVLLQEIFTVSVLLVIVPVTDVIFEPVMKENVGAVLLNCQPVGALKTITSTTLAPPLKSELAVSVIIIGPSVVKAGELAPAALLLQIPVPPVAEVTVTLACPVKGRMQSNKTMPNFFRQSIRLLPKLPMVKNRRKQQSFMNQNISKE